MKKLLLSVLCLTLLISATFFASGCKKKHTHSFTEQTVKDEYLSTASDCTNKARYFYSCSCGEKGSATFEYGSPLGHSLSGWKIQKEATETEKGLKTRNCTRSGCDYSESEDIPILSHTHNFNVESATDKYLATAATCTEKAKYYYSCSCGEKGTETFEYGEALNHSFTNYVSDNNATCTEDGTKTAKCDRCDETNTVTDVDSKLNHSFTNYVSDNNATCTKDGTKTAKCDRCNETNTVTDAGSKLNHSFTNYLSDNNATCTEDGTKTAKCDRCNETDTVTVIGSKLGHEFTNYVSDNNATYEKDGTKTAHCNREGCTATKTIPDEGSKLESKMSFKTLSVDGDKVYGKVSNDTDKFSFINEVEYSGLIKYFVSFDIYGNEKIDTKTISLKVGDNKVYITELLDGEPKAVYEVTIRRRPIYTVSFNSQGGTAVNSLSVEEDSIISEPKTTRTGYTLVNWSYDFTQPIMEDTDIMATWIANTDTVYKVEYYLENIDDADYSLYETSNLQGTTDTTATAEIKTYDHFTFYENNSILSGNVSGDGSLVLKVYYTRNTYTLSNANTSYGEITNATTKKYGNDKIDSVATEYLGCEFLGWYNREELLSIAKEYSFTVENNVTAKFKVKDEMSNFEFTSSIDTCSIKSVKDESSSEITIPDYVTTIGENAFHNCGGLTSITIPDSVTSIGKSAFIFCSSLTDVYYLGTIDQWAKIYFDNADSNPLINAKNLYINNELITEANLTVTTKISAYAFYFCSSLTSVTIGGSVTHIGGSAFCGCSGLTSISIPDNVTSIGDGAFCGCSSLTSVILGNGVKSIGKEAFSGCRGLTSVTIPDKVTFIDSYAFSGCNRLTSVIWKAEKCTQVGSSSYYIFRDCTNLRKVTIGDNVKVIPAYAFYYCSSLTSVTIGNSVTSIGSGAFFYCSSLTSIAIGNSVSSIGKETFYNCSNLTSVTIGGSVTSIGSNAFYDCSNLTSVNYLGTIDQWAEIYFYNNIANPLCYAKKLYINNDLATEVNLTAATKISAYAFFNCSGLTSATISDSVTSIGRNAFCGCNNLTSVTIGNGVTSIGDYAFYNCNNLTSVNYLGTMDQWKKIVKASQSLGSSIKKIICSDGTIEL